ncbi:MAG: hypothetical protein Q9174_005792, partial [Haloplaca sp. 1 TL-2023]
PISSSDDGDYDSEADEADFHSHYSLDAPSESDSSDPGSDSDEGSQENVHTGQQSFLHRSSSSFLSANAFAPPFYNKPPTPLPPSPSLTSLLRPSFSATTSRPTTPDSSENDTLNDTEAAVAKSARRATTVPRASPKLGIYYYPNRWWSLAVPAFLVMTLVYIYVALAAYNTEYLTLPMNSIENIVDEAANIASLDNLKHRRTRSASHSHDNDVHQEHWLSVWNEGTDAVMDVPIGGNWKTSQTGQPSAYQLPHVAEETTPGKSPKLDKYFDSEEEVQSSQLVHCKDLRNRFPSRWLVLQPQRHKKDLQKALHHSLKAGELFCHSQTRVHCHTLVPVGSCIVIRLAQWEGQSRKYYFVQRATGHSQWDIPTQPALSVPTPDPTPQPISDPFDKPPMSSERGPSEGGDNYQGQDRGFLSDLATNAVSGKHGKPQNQSGLGGLASSFLGGQGSHGSGGHGGGGSGGLAGQLIGGLLGGGKPHHQPQSSAGQHSGTSGGSGGYGSSSGGHGHGAGLGSFFGGQHGSSNQNNFGYSGGGSGSGSGGYQGQAPPSSYQPSSQAPSSQYGASSGQYHAPGQQSHQPAQGGYQDYNSSQYGQPPSGSSHYPQHNAGQPDYSQHQHQPYGGAPSGYPTPQQNYDPHNPSFAPPPTSGSHYGSSDPSAQSYGQHNPPTSGAGYNAYSGSQYPPASQPPSSYPQQQGGSYGGYGQQPPPPMNTHPSQQNAVPGGYPGQASSGGYPGQQSYGAQPGGQQAYDHPGSHGYGQGGYGSQQHPPGGSGGYGGGSSGAPPVPGWRA